MTGRPVAAGLLVLGLLAAAGCGGGAAPAGHPSASLAASPSPSAVIPVGAPLVLRTDSGFNPRTLGIKDFHPLDPDHAYVTTPHFNIGLDAVLTTSTLEQLQINAIGLNSRRGEPAVYGPLTAAPGHEFLLVHTTGGPRGLADTSLDGHATAAVRVGDQSAPVPTENLAWALIVAQVPVGADALLAITDAGQTVSISLRTGQRGESAPSFRALHGTGSLKTVIEVDRYGRLAVQLTLGATLEPYADGHGWAAPGRAWLQLTTEAAVVSEDIELHLAVADSFQPSWPGHPDRLPAGSLDTTTHQVLSSGGKGYYIDVPDGLRSLRYTIRMAMTVTSAKDHATLGWHPVGPASASGTITLA
jgi:hypothetical protein